MRLRELDQISSEPGFWDKAERAQILMRERTDLTSQIERLIKIEGLIDDVDASVELMEMGGEEEARLLVEEADELFVSARKIIEGMETERMLGGEHDKASAIITVNSGAGGTDSQDWAEMLLRMVLRFCERRGFSVEMVDHQDGSEAGIKRAELRVGGLYAYGLLKAEIGVHRLVRISPFDSAGRRHTAFASIHCIPDLDDGIEIEIDDKDLKIDTYRSSGAGGQHVNKTDSAVRITHMPSGIVVQCQNERSQHKNKATAMKILKAKLYDKEQLERAQEIDAINAQKREIAWGSQIRSYVLYPYRQVKDLRTEVVHNDPSAVLDGDLDDFITAYLLQEGSNASAGEGGQ